MKKQGKAKMITILYGLSLLISLNFSLQTNAATTHKRCYIPSRNTWQSFHQSQLCQNVGDMQVFNDAFTLLMVILIPTPDLIPVIYFEPAANKFVTHYTVNEEEINHTSA